MYFIKFIFVLLCLAFATLTLAIPLKRDCIQLQHGDLELLPLQRARRQFDLKVSAEHDDKEDETELALEAIANLWRSHDGNTQVEGSAKVVHRSNTLQSGNTRYSATFHLHHDYKRK